MGCMANLGVRMKVDVVNTKVSREAQRQCRDNQNGTFYNPLVFFNTGSQGPAEI